MQTRHIYVVVMVFIVVINEDCVVIVDDSNLDQHKSGDGGVLLFKLIY